MSTAEAQELLAAARGTAGICTLAASTLPSVRGGDLDELRRALKAVPQSLLAASNELRENATEEAAQHLSTALKSCLSTLEGFRCATSPAATMLASGWLSTRIHSALTDVGFALHALSASMGDEASAPASALSSAGYELMRLRLPCLDARAELCASMWAELEEAAECPEGLGKMRAQAGAWRVIRGVLVEASGAVPSLDDAEARDSLLQELQTLIERLGPLLTPSELHAASLLASCLHATPEPYPARPGTAPSPSIDSLWASGSNDFSASASLQAWVRPSSAGRTAWGLRTLRPTGSGRSGGGAGSPHVLEGASSGGSCCYTDKDISRELPFGPWAKGASAVSRAASVATPCRPAPFLRRPSLPDSPAPQPRRTSVPRSFLCAITHELMRDPVVNALGFTYERAAIEAWLRNHDTDPETRQRLPNKDLAPNWTVKGLIRDWLEETGRTYEDWRNLDELEGMDEQADGLDEHDEQEAAVEAREPRARPHPRLLDYVTLAPGPRLPLDARRGPLARGQYGIVIAARDCKDVQQSAGSVLLAASLRVRSLHEPFKAWWYNPAALVRVDPSAVPRHRRLILPPQRPGSAVPVTHFTAQEGMLVRRGYDWLDPADRNGLGDETGVLLSADPGARNHRVLWAGGAVECYRTGHGNHFELQHLQVAHPGCGVPVCAAQPVVPGSGVVLGTGERDGRVSSDLGSLELPDGGAGRASGWVAARWADGQRTHHLAADPEGGHELHHCPREGEPVTVYTAQAELRVTRGQDWRWDDADGCGREGRLVRPLGLGGDFVWWEVKWSDASTTRCRVGLPGIGSCDLQVAMYEADPVNGHVSLGTPVVLAESGGGAPDGALRPGKPGVVAETLGVRVKVLHVPTGVECWYDRASLRPLPGVLAAAQSRRMVLNRDGRAAFLGRGAARGSGGDTGRPAKEVFYCGAELGQCRCGRCGSTCGPLSGCPCAACVELLGLRVGAGGRLELGGDVECARRGAEATVAMRALERLGE